MPAAYGDARVLKALRDEWGRAYKFGWDQEEGYWAVPADGLSGPAPDHNGAAFIKAVRADFDMRPVRRDPRTAPR